MSRNEKLILVKDFPGTVVNALDALLQTMNYRRTIIRTLDEDFSPLLDEEGGPTMFVLSMPQNDWIACFTSLPLEAEWELAEAMARSLEEPLVSVVFAADSETYVYRYFENGDVREEALAEAPDDTRLDEAGLIQRLERHGIDLALIDDRTEGISQEHVVVGYERME